MEIEEIKQDLKNALFIPWNIFEKLDKEEITNIVKSFINNLDEKINNGK
jgi:hypothetical protein